MTQTIGIVGLGAMGLGIAQVFAQAGFRTIVTDANAPTRDTARTRMAEALDARIASGKLTEAARDATLSQLQVVDSLNAFAPCDLVIEAIVERADAKLALFALAEAVLSQDAMFWRHLQRVISSHGEMPVTVNVSMFTTACSCSAHWIGYLTQG